jgi:hypothetical protein
LAGKLPAGWLLAFIIVPWRIHKVRQQGILAGDKKEDPNLFFLHPLAQFEKKASWCTL